MSYRRQQTTVASRGSRRRHKKMRYGIAQMSTANILSVVRTSQVARECRSSNGQYLRVSLSSLAQYWFDNKTCRGPVTAALLPYGTTGKCKQSPYSTLSHLQYDILFTASENPYPLALLETISFHSGRGGPPHRPLSSRRHYGRPSWAASRAISGTASKVRPAMP